MSQLTAREIASMSGDAPAGDWPPAPPGTTAKSKSPRPDWQKIAIGAAATVGVALLGVAIARRSGKTDEEIKADLKGAASDAKSAARKGAKQAKETGKDAWGFTKEKAQEAKADLPGQTQKLVDDVKTAAWEGGKDIKKGAAAVAGKAKGAFEEEVKPDYGFLGWRHVFNNPK